MEELIFLVLDIVEFILALLFLLGLIMGCF